MRRRFRTYKLSENAYGTAYPSPTEHILDMSRLDGGLNLWELPYKLPTNQSPDLLNVYWKDGALHSRQGQAYIKTPSQAEATVPGASYERPWGGKWIYKWGYQLFSFDPDTKTTTELYRYMVNANQMAPEFLVSFFPFGDYLYVLGSGAYIRIDESMNVEEIFTARFDSPYVTNTRPYVPLIVINRRPDGTGGDLYEDENRLTGYRRVQFTADGTSTDYKLPSAIDEGVTVTAVVNGTAASVSVLDRSAGTVRFDTAPSQDTPAKANNVEITYSYQTTVANFFPIVFSAVATVYKAGEAPVVVCGGDGRSAIASYAAEVNKNSYFWSGVTASGPDPTYFPFGNYGYAGEGSDPIVAFGHQQSSLIIFKEHSLGKASWSTSSIEDMDYLNLLYSPINDRIGCDLRNSVQLIDNNLVFANTERGVFVLANTSSADENNVLPLSRNVEKKLLSDIAESKSTVFYQGDYFYAVSSFDDGERYWLCANGFAYVWDYRLSTYRSKEEKLSWFLFGNINAICWLWATDFPAYVGADGSITQFISTFSDFDQPINRKYAFAVQYFGTYDRLKDVLRVIFNCQSNTGCFIDIEYNTDYEDRHDLTPLDLRGGITFLVPRNFKIGRNLRVIKYAGTAVRIPRCFHVRHFGMTLYNSELNADLTLIGAQIIYRYSRRDR